MSYSFAIDARVEDAARARAIFALNLSGGKDSSLSAHAANAMLDALGHPRTLRFAIHADLGRAEWRATAATVERQARHLDLPLVVVRRSSGDMVSRWEQRYEQGWTAYEALKLVRLRSPWSSASLRFCTGELKADPIRQYLGRAHRGQTIVSVIGIRHEESAGRAATPISKLDSKLQRRDGTSSILWHPSIHITEEQVYAYHREHGLPLHEAYETYGAGRLSCAACVVGGLREMTAALRAPSNFPLYCHLAAMEIRTGFSFQPNRWLAEQASELLDETDKTKLAEAKSYAAKRRSVEATISRNFFETSSRLP